MDNNERVALVTGGNRGIGFEVCRELKEKGYQVIVGARDPSSGAQAVEKLSNTEGAVHLLQLDVTKSEDIQHASEWIDQKFGRLDVLVNNAAVFSPPGGKDYVEVRDKKGEDYVGRKRVSFVEIPVMEVQQVMAANTLGPYQLCQQFFPIMKKHGYGRIVNVSSGLGQLNDMGGYFPGYRLSKASLNVMTRFIAAEAEGTNILINSVCPGWVATHMGGANAPKNLEQGAETIVWLATLPEGGPNGGFFRDRKSIPW